MFRRLSLFLILFGIMLQTQASIVIIGTRVIYPAAQRSVNVELENRDPHPVLVQAWLDKGNPNVNPNQIKTPFVITPPITRVERQSRQTLRIRYTGEALPQDRESLFYLNVLDVPPKPKAENQQTNTYMQLTVRSRLKFFFRPSNLPYDVSQAYAKVTWQAQGKTLTANNNTPYYITYNQIQLANNANVQKPEMIAPFSQKTFTLNKSAVGNEVIWTIINDYGASQTGRSTLK